MSGDVFNFETARKNLEARGFAVSMFEDKKSAGDYLVEELQGLSVGIGGSVTVDTLDIRDRLSENGELYWHWYPENGDIPGTLKKAATAEAYLTSANGIAETGEIINIDGRGNRVASMLDGHKRLYIIAGINKFAASYDDALYRARNIAAPKNAQRLSQKTPCAEKADRCYDCKSEARICNSLVVLWGKLMSVERVEVVIINEELGY